MKLFPKIEYQSIFAAFGSSIASWLYNLCEAFRGNWYTDNSIWVLEILKKKIFSKWLFHCWIWVILYTFIYIAEMTQELRCTCLYVANLPHFLMSMNFMSMKFRF